MTKCPKCGLCTDAIQCDSCSHQSEPNSESTEPSKVESRNKAIRWWVYTIPIFIFQAYNCSQKREAPVYKPVHRPLQLNPPKPIRLYSDEIEEKKLTRIQRILDQVTIERIREDPNFARLYPNIARRQLGKPAQVKGSGKSEAKPKLY